MASTPRSFDKQSNEWKDGETLFMRCSIWRQPAENLAESLTRGARVVVTGRLKQRSYEKDGEKRTVVELDAEEVGASMRYAVAKVQKAGRSSDSGQRSSRSGGHDDPWGSVPPPSGPTEDEPPF